ncbi:MAG: aminotransferase class I/II-fold pyridoxal phosphate-dependent enzyme, partial [Zwartia sp.]
IDPSQIVVTVGSLGALSLAFRTLLDTNDEVLILEPFWGPYANMVKLFGANPVVIPAVEVGGVLLPDFVALEKSITERTKLVILNSPNNPSGKVWSLPELQCSALFAKSTIFGLFQTRSTVSWCMTRLNIYRWRRYRRPLLRAPLSQQAFQNHLQ